MPKINGQTYQGITEAYGTSFIVEFGESKKYPGYYHYSICCVADKFYDESKKPILASALLPFLQKYLNKDHGITLNELNWEIIKKEEIIFLLQIKEEMT